MSNKNYEFYVKIHDDINRRVIAICDKNILGKTFEDDKLQIDVSERFYKGELMNQDQIKELLETERNINAVGCDIINLCIELNIINKSDVLYVNDTPHIQLIAP